MLPGIRQDASHQTFYLFWIVGSTEHHVPECIADRRELLDIAPAMAAHHEMNPHGNPLQTRSLVDFVG